MQKNDSIEYDNYNGATKNFEKRKEKYLQRIFLYLYASCSSVLP